MTVAVARHKDLVTSLAAVVPKGFWRAWRGPASLLVVRSDNVEMLGRLSALRPIDLLVSPELVLKHRLVLPPLKQQDLTEAVRLFIRTETPFRPEDLLIEVSRREEASGDVRDAIYDVLMVPRPVVEGALKKCRARRWMVRSVFVASNIEDAQQTSLARALSPFQWIAAWLQLLPVILIVGALSATGARQVSLADTRIQLLSSEVSAATEEVATLARELERREVTAQTVASVISVARFLDAIQRARRADTEIIEVSVDLGTAQATVVSADPLSDVAAFASAWGEWTVGVAGSITREPEGKQRATLLFRSNQ